GSSTVNPCPGTPSPGSSIANRCPGTPSPGSSIANRCPGTPSPGTSTVNPCPGTPSPGTSTANPCPGPHSPGSSIANPCPGTHIKNHTRTKSHTHKITHKKTRHPDAWSPLKYSSDMLGSVNCDRFVCEYFPGVVLQFLRDLLTQPPVDGFECFPEHERPHFCMLRVTCDDMDQPVFYHLERRFLQFFAEVSRNGSGGHLGECAFIHQLV